MRWSCPVDRGVYIAPGGDRDGLVVRRLAIPDPILHGSLRETPARRLILSLARDARSGLLRLEREDASKTIRFEGGRIRFATTNRAEERLGAVAVRSQLATWWQVQEAAREISTTRRLGTVMVDHGILSASEQTRVIRDQLRGIVVEALGWTEGSFRFDPTEAPLREKVTLDWSAEEAILEEARRSPDDNVLWTVVGGPEGRVLPSDTLRRPPEGMNPTEARVMAALDGRRTVAEVVREAAVPMPLALRTLAAVVRIGDCRVLVGRPDVVSHPVPRRGTSSRLEAEGVGGRHAPYREPAEGPADTPWQLPWEARAERAAVLDLAERLDGMDHYQILDIPAGSPPERVERAARERLTRFHPDRSGSAQLRGLAPELERIRHAVAVAHATLREPGARAAYDARREAAWRSHREHAAAAEESCHAFLEHGTRLIRQGRFQDAIPPLREAIRLRPEMAVAHYRLGQCLTTVPGGIGEARTRLEEANRLEPANPRYRDALQALSTPRVPAARPGLARRLGRWLQIPLGDED